MDDISHRLPDGSFCNPWPHSAPHGWRDVLKWMAQRFTTRRAATPPRGSFATAAPAVLDPRGERGERGELRATWVGHSTVLLQMGGLNLLTDPIFSQRASPVQWAGPRRVMDPGLSIDDLPPLDAVLISHNHYDHLDAPSVERIVRDHPGAKWIVPVGVGAYVRRWGVASSIELDWWQTAEVGGFKATATPARHFSGRGLGDRNDSLWCGYGVEAGGHRVLFVGDSAYHPDFGEIGARCGPFDLVMMPIGAYDPRWFMGSVHMDPAEAVQAYRDVVDSHPDAIPPVILGIHWGTFRLTDEPMDEPPELTTERWREAGLDERLLWIGRFGETREIVAGH